MAFFGNARIGTVITDLMRARDGTEQGERFVPAPGEVAEAIDGFVIEGGVFTPDEDFYYVTLEPNTRYDFRVTANTSTSANLDPVLALYDDAFLTPNSILTDDDSGGALNPAIVGFTTGPFRQTLMLEVDTYANAGGARDGGGAEKLAPGIGPIVAATLSGGPGNETLIGGGSNDNLSGGGGNDTLAGLGGNDTLRGGDGNDVIYFGEGADFVDGGAGADTLYRCGSNDFDDTVVFDPADVILPAPPGSQFCGGGGTQPPPAEGDFPIPEVFPSMAVEDSGELLLDLRLDKFGSAGPARSFTVPGYQVDLADFPGELVYSSPGLGQDFILSAEDPLVGWAGLTGATLRLSGGSEVDVDVLPGTVLDVDDAAAVLSSAFDSIPALGNPEVVTLPALSQATAGTAGEGRLLVSLGTGVVESIRTDFSSSPVTFLTEGEGATGPTGFTVAQTEATAVGFFGADSPEYEFLVVEQARGGMGPAGADIIGNTPGQSLLVPPGSALEGVVNTASDTDVYSVFLEEGETLVATLTGLGGEFAAFGLGARAGLRAALLDTDAVQRDAGLASGDDPAEILAFTATEDGFHFLEIEGAGGDAFHRPYRLDVALQGQTASLSGNRMPVARPDSATAEADRTVTIDVLANDSDPDGDGLTLIGVEDDGVLGSVELVNGQIRYDPRGVDFGDTGGGPAVETLRYAVSDGHGGSSNAVLTIEVRDERPPEPADDAATATVGQGAVEIDVLANDTDPDGTALEVVAFDADGLAGALTLLADGRFRYDPGTAFDGLGPGGTAIERFGYTVRDGAGEIASAEVTVTVRGAPGTGQPPVAVADGFAVAAGAGEVPLAVLGNDSDPDGDALTILAVSTPDTGTTRIEGGGGRVLYTPADGFTGQDSFSYTIADSTGRTATATVDVAVSAPGAGVTARDDAAATTQFTPIFSLPVLANDTGAERVVELSGLTTGNSARTEGGRIFNNGDGTLAYAPRQGFTGTDRFDYVAEGPGGARDTGSVAVSVAPIDPGLAVARLVGYLYEAGLGRVPAAEGLNFWAGTVLEGGRDETFLANRFLISDEFSTRAGGEIDTLSDRELVEQLFLNVLERPGREAGIANFVEDLADPNYSREDLLIEFAESPENLLGSPEIATIQEFPDGSFDFA